MLHVNSDATWKPLTGLERGKKSATNRGYNTGDAVADALKATQVNAMLTFIGTYSPSTTFKEITTRCTSLVKVWEIIRRWAGVKASGNKLLGYFELLHAFDPSGSQSYQDYYFTLREAHEA